MAKKENKASPRPRSPRRTTVIGANTVGAGGGALLVGLLQGLPDGGPWKHILLYCAPAFSLAVRRSFLWVIGQFGWYVDRKWDAFRELVEFRLEMARIDQKTEELRKIRGRDDLTAEQRSEIDEELSKLNISRLEAVRGLKEKRK